MPDHFFSDWYSFALRSYLRADRGQKSYAAQALKRVTDCIVAMYEMEALPEV